MDADRCIMTCRLEWRGEVSMRIWETHPMSKMTLMGGDGSTVWDSEGKPYLDLLSGTWSSVLGHKHPRWVQAVQEQATGLVHTGPAFASAEVSDAMARFEEILPPSLNRMVLLNTGSEAVELSLKMARAATGRDVIAVNENGYYGATTYALALSEAGRKAEYLSRIGEGILRLPSPDCGPCSAECRSSCEGALHCLDALRELAEAGDTSVAAILYSPVLGNGIIVPPPGYGAQLRELATRLGAVLIAEEVTTGLGRTGRWFGFEHEAIVPDILVIGKAIGAGLPIAAVVTTEEVERRCRGILAHVQSHQNDPFSGRMAATVISTILDERLVEAAAERGETLMDGLRQIQGRGTWIHEVRGRGLMIGAEMTPEYAAQGPSIKHALLEAGFIVDYHLSTSTFRFFPAYVITSQEISAFLSAFEDILRTHG